MRVPDTPPVTPATGPVELRVGCRFHFEAGEGSPIAMMVEPASSDVSTTRWTLPDGLELAPAEHDAHGNRIRRLNLPAGASAVEYEATVSVPPGLDPRPPDGPQHRVEDLPTAVLPYLLPSRYCESDRLAEMAWKQFGAGPEGAGRVQAVCDWVHARLTFKYGTTDSRSSACDVLEGGFGVCRDFTHLAVALCRALTIPTRYAFGYLPEIDVPPATSPMDFCAWMQVYLQGAWWTYDPRNNARRIGRTPIGHGRDAADVPMVTTWGPVELRSMRVTAEPAG